LFHSAAKIEPATCEIDLRDVAMNLVPPFLEGAAEVAGIPGYSVTSFLKMLADRVGLFPGEGVDSAFDLLMSGLAGVAAAVAVAIALTVYFQIRYRSARELVRHGLAATLVLGLLAFAAYDMRNAALAYLGINPAKPAAEFEIRLPKTTATTLAQTQIELHTDRNQALVQVDGVGSDDEGRSVLKGSVALDFRTADRVMVLNLPGQAQCEFKLRLAASPSHSDQFGPWHLADRVIAPGDGTRDQPHKAFAIRYRVL
jgi:hypothetical protein